MGRGGRGGRIGG
uniref:Uncharacterized protein n=1 Tax=Arundo donax TaxID=35708 RepID=A0A0A9DSG7_ARUDO